MSNRKSNEKKNANLLINKCKVISSSDIRRDKGHSLFVELLRTLQIDVKVQGKEKLLAGSV